MERRTALAYAAAVAGTVLAGSTAFAATTGFLGGDDPATAEIEGISSADAPLETSTTLAEPTVMTVVVDEYVTAPTAGSAVSAGSALDDNGGLRPVGASDDSPDLFDDHGGDRPDDVSDDDHDDDGDDDHDDDRDDDGHEDDD
jgi:hypothetical protein